MRCCFRLVNLVEKLKIKFRLAFDSKMSPNSKLDTIQLSTRKYLCSSTVIESDIAIAFDLNLTRERKIRFNNFQLKKLFEFILLKKSTVQNLQKTMNRAEAVQFDQNLLTEKSLEDLSKPKSLRAFSSTFNFRINRNSQKHIVDKCGRLDSNLRLVKICDSVKIKNCYEIIVIGKILVFTEGTFPVSFPLLLHN